MAAASEDPALATAFDAYATRQIGPTPDAGTDAAADDRGPRAPGGDAR